jgi:DNA-binding CsgD family transcriptional regulator
MEGEPLRRARAGAIVGAGGTMSGPGRSDEVRFDELQGALRLALELRELPRGSELQRRHALEGMARLVGAQVGMWIDVDGMTSGRVILRSAIDLGWSGDTERRSFLTYVDSAQWISLDPSMPALARATRSPMCTFTREQLLDDRSWYGSDHVQHFRREARVDSFIYATYAPGGDQAVSFSLHRPWGERPFCERERRLIDLFHHECAFLHEPPSDVDPALLRGLAPRLCDTLRGLARGRSEKQLAADLGLSPHTVHEYVKALHRHFGVQSRSELLARCLAAR